MRGMRGNLTDRASRRRLEAVGRALLKRGAGMYALLECGTVAMYWLALLTNVRPIASLTGAALAFYIPGAVLIRSSGGLFADLLWVERAALSVVLSVTLVALTAFCLDFTPWGITRIAISAVVTVLLVIASALAIITSRWPRYRHSHRATG
jgi:uncharacterized membrane protein